MAQSKRGAKSDVGLMVGAGVAVLVAGGPRGLRRPGKEARAGRRARGADGPAHRPAFATVLAHDPDNGVATYGRGLLAAMTGGGKGGEALRAKGVALDPKAPAAIEARYGFYIDARYKP